MPAISIINSALKDEFLLGHSGDCILRFTVNGYLAVQKRLESAVLKHIPHFKRQLDFQEGHAKIFVLDISSFVEGICFDVKEFVDLSLLAVFDDSAAFARNVNLKTRYALISFRDYLDLPYGALLKVPLPTIRAEDRELYKNVLEKCGGRMFERLLDQHFRILRQSDLFNTFPEQWIEAYNLLIDYVTREDVRAKSLFNGVYKWYFCDTIHCLGRGPVEFFALKLEFADASDVAPHNIRGVAQDIAKAAIQVVSEGGNPEEEGGLYLTQGELLRSEIFQMKSERFRRHAHTAVAIFLTELQHFLRHFIIEKLTDKKYDKRAKRKLKVWSANYFNFCVDTINSSTLALYQIPSEDSIVDSSMAEQNV